MNFKCFSLIIVPLFTSLSLTLHIVKYARDKQCTQYANDS